MSTNGDMVAHILGTYSPTDLTDEQTLALLHLTATAEAGQITLTATNLATRMRKSHRTAQRILARLAATNYLTRTEDGYSFAERFNQELLWGS